MNLYGDINLNSLFNFIFIHYLIVKNQLISFYICLFIQLII